MNENFKMRLNLLALLIACCFQGQAQSGQWKYGFDIGLAFATVMGEEESGPEVEEDIRFTTGFHMTVFGRYFLTDQAGFQIGLSYSQRGNQNLYRGRSYYLFGLNDEGVDARSVMLDRREDSAIRLNYLELPVMGFYRIGSRLEVGLGAYVGYCVSARSSGSLFFIDGEENHLDVESIFFQTTHNYFKDEFQRLESEDELQLPITVGSTTYTEPRFLTAYYLYTDDPMEKLYQRLDFGLTGQLGFYISEGLQLKGRLTYGLPDLTRKEADLSRATLDENNRQITRDDRDQNLAIQVTIGFLF